MPEQVHTFAAHGANLSAMRTTAPRVLLAGPAGTGKTRAILEKLHRACLKRPRVKCLVLRQTLVSLTASGVQTYEKDVATEAILDGTVTFFGGSLRQPPAFLYSNGSSISLGGLDKPMKFMSTEFDIIYVQEGTECSMEALDMLTTRLRNGRLSYHQLMIDANPDSPTHPLKIETDTGRMLMLHSRHEDNPRFFNRDGTMTEEGARYMSVLDALTGVRYLRLRKGIWAAAEGVIFDEFNAAVHVVDRFEIPRDWRRIWAVDFGYVHPFVWQDWAIDPDGAMVLVRAIHRTKRLVEDHARDIKQLTAGDPPPYALFCDHDAEDRATLERHLGRPTRPANKNVSEGLQATAARFRIGGDGKPRIKIMRDGVVHGMTTPDRPGAPPLWQADPELVSAKQPACLADEIPGYVWEDGKVKEQPHKDLDDSCDTLRYAVAAVDLQGRARIRMLG